MRTPLHSGAGGQGSDSDSDRRMKYGIPKPHWQVWGFFIEAMMLKGESE
jgi:hypothetical protein